MTENNNLILEAIKSLITEEQLDDAIRSIVAERMKYNFERMIRDEAERIARERLTMLRQLMQFRLSISKKRLKNLKRVWTFTAVSESMMHCVLMPCINTMH